MKLNGAQNGDPTGVNPITKVQKYDFGLNEIILFGYFKTYFGFSRAEVGFEKDLGGIL